MAKLNFLININSYLDTAPSNNPSLNLFRWTRDVTALAVDKPQGLQFSLAPGESRTLFDGTRTLLHDGTTQYELALKAGTTSTYVLKHVGGTAPQFRAARTTGADATTAVTVTKNGSVLTFASTGGTLMALIAGGVVVGDQVKIGTAFSAVNQGTFKVIAIAATSLSVENADGAAEALVVLGAGFEDEIRIFGAAGVQAGDTVKITGGFSPATQAAYEVTAVADNQIEFYSTASLPLETVTTNALTIYSQAKRMIYIESDKKVSVNLNGSPQGNIEPLISAAEIRPGMMLKTETAWSLEVTNDSLDTANLFVASVE